MISFSELNLSLLPNLRSHLNTWLPGGTYAGDEYTVRNPRRDDKTPGSFKINVRTGGWCDFATGDKGGDPISLYAYINGLTNGKAAGELTRSLGLDARGSTQATPPPAKDPDHNTAWADILWPCPADAPVPPDVRHVKTDSGWQHYTITLKNPYYNQLGQLLGYSMRYEIPTGKEVLPLTLWKTADGVAKWRWKSFPEPRPLYNLNKVAHSPSATIIIVEGEKCAEVLQGIIESAGAQDKLCAVTWPGGCKAVNKVDWSPLKDRKIILWPDADEPGITAMNTIAGKLKGL